MTYNKKQINPLIDKFQINPETNKLFISIMEMFDGQPNYQSWAVKVIFSQVIDFNKLKEIHDWIVDNQGAISKLEKKNIVSYNSKKSIEQLEKEMKGINMVSFIKNIISHFNTEQKKLLTKEFFKGELTPLQAYSNSFIKEWYGILKAFNKKPMARKNNFYSTCSAFKNAPQIMAAIKDCLKEEYSWELEDFMSFVDYNTKDCDVVFSKDNVVILRVNSFDSSKKLCGSGRTQWCITREKHFFDDYVDRHNGARDQYFLFDFNRNETDCFAHVGFTFEKGNGIIYAQTCDNKEMLHGFTQGKENIDIKGLLSKLGVKQSTFMSLPKNIGFEWNLQSIIQIVKKNPQDYAIAYENDGKIIISTLNNDAFKRLTNWTFIKGRIMQVDTNRKIYVLLDLNKPFNEDESVVAMLYTKDEYGTYSLTTSYETFGNEIRDKKRLLEIGIDDKKFLNQEKIDPSILLHKLIDQGNENEAIQLLMEEYNNIDVNFEFNMRIPIFSAVNARMPKLYSVILNHPKFSCDIMDGCGETLLGTLLFIYGSEQITKSDKDKDVLEQMISATINCKNYNLNEMDITEDTPLSTACAFEMELWVVKALVSNPNVNVNTVNDTENSVIGECLVHNNTKALELIGQRPDLKVTPNDKKMAKKFGINLDEFIKPNSKVFEMEYSLAMARA